MTMRVQNNMSQGIPSCVCEMPTDSLNLLIPEKSNNNLKPDY